MSIAEKLTTIAENEQKVYDKGIEDGNLLKKTTDWYQMFYSGRRNDLLSHIKYNDTSHVTNMEGAFYYIKGVTELPNMDTSKVTDFTNFCRASSTLEVFPDLDYSNATKLTSAFNNCSKLSNRIYDGKNVPDLDLSSATITDSMFYLCRGINHVGKLKMGNVTNAGYMFYGCAYLNYIDEIDLSSATNANNIFHSCVNLKQVIFKGSIKTSLNLSASTYLTYETLISAINALTDRTGEETVKTLTLGTTNLAKITDEEKAIATEKGWTLA